MKPLASRYAGVLTQETLNAWLDQISEKATLVAPRTVDGIVVYRTVAGSDEITFDYTRPKMSPVPKMRQFQRCLPKSQ